MPLNNIQQELVKVGLKAGRTSAQIAKKYGLTKEYVDSFVKELNNATEPRESNATASLVE